MDIVYNQGGASQSLYGPFLSTISISPDFGANNSCSTSSGQVVLSGLYDPANTTTLNLTGATSTQLLSGANFQFTLCLQTGVTALTLTAYNSQHKANQVPLQISINITTQTSNALMTLGYGSPRYPSTGFQFISNNPNWLNYTSAGVTMENSFIGPIATTSLSANNTGYILSTGFTNYIATQSP